MQTVAAKGAALTDPDKGAFPLANQILTITENPVFDSDDQIMLERAAAAACGMSLSTFRRRNQEGSGPKRIRITDRRYGYTPRLLREWREANIEDPTTTA